MKVNIDIDEEHEGTSITIQTDKWTDELEHLLTLIKKETPKRLFGVDEDQTILLNPKEIDFIYAENRKVYAALQNRRLEIRMKLYEIENMLASQHFMRFSKSVIGNINRIQRFELSFNGNLCVYFTSGNKEYITRKYVTSVKEKLAMGGTDHDN
ncbi:LytTR family DNA-binding domain-containing protein [Pseudogracilibacillus auburnensis]|uniref:LytTR family DNA-binding domain-containing protein n=1 Tax=Pseudogracilibacillus auburnensis TaxID=1494959 RepID=UPI001A9571C7|nr:LytTR family DNA-binding domain-containing protein [Pseudogracilibacillus auburnensis]MBO1004219.1 LytTR family transcriptional regulator [Pseudogracilibacillus auburnensis]